MLQYCFCFMFWFFSCKACGILAPQPGIKPVPPPLDCKVHWTAREVPTLFISDRTLYTPFSSNHLFKEASSDCPS